jgi:hypothetical protein
MAKQNKKIEKQTSRDFCKEELGTIIKELFIFMHGKPEHVFIDDFLILEKQLLKSDLQILVEKNEDFAIGIKNALEIEKTKLIKYGSADKFNASFVKEVLQKKHNFY